MCERFTLRTGSSELCKQFEVSNRVEFPPRFNISPIQYVYALRKLNGARVLTLMRWGLVPSWVARMDRSFRWHVAFAETINKKPAFRGCFRHRRCLIPADGYYQWKQDGFEWRNNTINKQPYFVHLKGDQAFAFAGVWDTWQDFDDAMQSCAIVTIKANNLMYQISDRLPVILHERDYDFWLNPQNTDSNGLHKLLKEYPEQQLELYPVSTRINSPRGQNPELIQPLA